MNTDSTLSEIRLKTHSHLWWSRNNWQTCWNTFSYEVKGHVKMQCNTVGSPWRNCWCVRSSELPWAGRPHDARAEIKTPHRSMSPCLNTPPVYRHLHRYTSLTNNSKIHFKKKEKKVFYCWTGSLCLRCIHVVEQWSRVYGILLFSLNWGVDSLMLSNSEERKHKMFIDDFNRG